ncbi:hypothetical protein N7E81_07860 [Reichenbachiella carrageenanivorans]|uniref:Sugar phosphate isomerase/epimerase n=1 Tax=Reichenbachiella carrageenanivorans TaxID=2979869 RepID=A0ABY6D4D1_9BACT|nr:hypothetical protein [Reichenbachiella carrageenanivorans]UXX81012.1 hypothetical protein N7E81_07860 [Reichenbachiella carrageenanivorans]
MNKRTSLSYWISLGNLKDLKKSCNLALLPWEQRLMYIKEQGFEGVAGIHEEIDTRLFETLGLQYASGVSFLHPAAGLDALRKSVDLGVASISVHLGHGLEPENEIDRWIEMIYEFTELHHTAIYLETHRGTCTQDIRSCIALAKRHPYIQWTGDFSHWYNGLLLGQYFDQKISYLSPIFKRTHMLHGRVASDGCIQPPMNQISAQTWAHYQALWQETLTQSEAPIIPIVIELLSHKIGYDPGVWQAGSPIDDLADRWQDALYLKQKLNHWFQ